MKLRNLILGAAFALLSAASAFAQPGAPYAIAAAKSFSWQVVIGDTSNIFTPMASPGGGVKIASKITLPSGQSGTALYVTPTFTTFTSGTTAAINGILIDAPAITSSGATITAVANLKIAAAATAGSSNYSLWNVGTTRADDTISVTKTTNQLITGTSTNLTTVNFPASSGAVTLTMPNTTDTMVGRATTDTLTNKTLTAPVFTTPSLGVFSATSGTITATTNQLLMGTTNVTTFNAASPAASAVVDLPTVAGGIPSASTCGTTTTCSAAAATVNVVTKFGTVALSSASPSTATVTGLPFASGTSYVCTASPEGTSAAIAAGGIAVSRTNGSTLVLTGPNTVSTVIHYVCTGI